ncbi:MAG: hypothetical protein Q9220_000063 [cf. Caloplaca sp. 1 TL-2023]
MASNDSHAAIFSTKGACCPPRGEQSIPARIVLRSVPEEDMESLIEQLWAKFPEQCRSLTLPLGDIHQYFDFYDQQQQGSMFLTAVLSEICQRNLVRRQRVIEYTQEWLRINQPAFQNLHICEFPFSEDDVEVHGVDFLDEVLVGLRLQRTHIDSTFAPDQSYKYASAPTRVEHLGTGDLPYLPSPRQQLWLNDTLNLSAPASSQIAIARPQMPSSLPSSTPDMMQPNEYHPKFPQQTRRLPSAKIESSNGPLRSAPLYPAFRQDWHSDPTDSGVDFPRPGFSDRTFTIPPPAGSGDPHMYPRMQTGTQTSHHPASKERRSSNAKRPPYTGYSNDARLLGHQNVPRRYGSFGESHASRIHKIPSGPPMSYTNVHPPLQQFSGPWPVNPFHIGGYSESNTARHTVGAGLVETPHAQLSINGHEGGPSVPQDRNSLARPKMVHGQYQPAHALPPRPGLEHFHDKDTLKQHKQYDKTPPRLVQGPSDGSFVDSPTPRRSSSTWARNGSISTQATRHRQISSASRTHTSQQDDSAYSDRQVWIGGLPLDTDMAKLSDILQKWGTVALEPRVIRRNSIPHEFHGSHGFLGSHGFTFAKFLNPGDAAAAIEALNSQIIDSLHTRLYLRLARLMPKQISESPKKQKSSSSGGMDNDRRHQKANEGQPQGYQNIDAAAAVRTGTPAPSEESVIVASKEGRFNAGRHTAGNSTSQAAAAPGDGTSQVNEVLDPEPLPLASGHDTQGESANYALVKSHSKDVVCGPAPTTNISRKAVPAAPVTPSSKHSKARQTNKDGSVYQKASPKKENVANLNLEATKLSTIDSVDRQNTTTSQRDEHVVIKNDLQSTGNFSLKPVEQESTLTKSKMQNAVTNQDSAIVALADDDHSKRGTSPFRGASKSRRRLSSTSLIATIDHTSCAQCEHSGKSIDEVGTLTDHPKRKALMPRVKADTDIIPTGITSKPKPELTSRQKRPFLGDPRVLVAVPKIIPVVRTETRRKKVEVAPSYHLKHLGDPSNAVDPPKNSTSSSDFMSDSGKDASQKENFDRIPSPGDVVEGCKPPNDDVERASSTVRDDLHEKSVDSSTMYHFDALSDNVASLDGDSFNSAQTTLKDESAPAVDSGEQAPSMPIENQHPVVQQKKRKIKKESKSKKSRPSVATSAETGSEDLSQNNSFTEISTVAQLPKAEMPFMSDDNQRLLVPAFTKRNHSSMHSRTVGRPGIFQNASQHVTVNDGDNTNALAYDPMILAYTAKPPMLIICYRGIDESNSVNFSSEDAGQGPPPNAGVAPLTPADDLLDDSSNKASHRWEGGDSVIEEPYASMKQTDECSDAERQARWEQIEEHCRQNTVASRAEIMDMLNTITPRKPSDTTASREVSDEYTQEGHTPDSSDAGSRTSITVEGPLIQESASHDDLQSSLPSTISMEDTEKDSKSARYLPTFPQSCGNATDDTKVIENLRDDTKSDDIFSSDFPKIQSPKSSPYPRWSSPERRDRLQSISPTKGLGLSIVPPPFSNNQENTSPSGRAPRKTLSYKEVAIAPSTPLIQPGDIVEIVSQDEAADGKIGQGNSVVRKVGTKDPWRVPSSEQPWGAPDSKP